MSTFNRETVLSFFLGFVVLWFGGNEIMSPERWTVFVPAFLGITGDLLNYLVVAHGIVLALSGICLIFNFHRRLAASVVFLMILSIVFTLVSTSGLDEIAVRDIGLLGMALALALRN